MTVPAVAFAPDLPEVTASADATHNCPISITDAAGSRDSGPECDPCHDDCAPSTDPCDHVDCNPDPCGTLPCNPPVPCVNDPCPDPDAVELSEMIRWTTTHPETAYVGDTPTVATHLHNNMSVPLLVTLEFEPETSSVCSVESYSTSAGSTTGREHEYLLLPNGTTEMVSPIDGQGVFAHNLSLSVHFHAETPGTCRLAVRAVVQTVGGADDVGVGAVTPEFTTKSPPGNVAELTGEGDITVETGTSGRHAVRPSEPDEPVVVEAGDVNVTAAVDYLTCGREYSNFVMTRISTDRNDDGDYDDDVDTVTATEIDDPGRTEAKGNVTLDEGNHTFRVRTKLFKGWFRPACAVALGAAAGIGGAWYFGVEAISMGTVTRILLPVAIAGLAECANPVLARGSYLVRVKAVDTEEDSTTDQATKVAQDLLAAT